MQNTKLAITILSYYFSVYFSITKDTMNIIMLIIELKNIVIKTTKPEPAFGLP